jgi:hypothetical protein
MSQTIEIGPNSFHMKERDHVISHVLQLLKPFNGAKSAGSDYWFIVEGDLQDALNAVKEYYPVVMHDTTTVVELNITQMAANRWSPGDSALREYLRFWCSSKFTGKEEVQFDIAGDTSPKSASPGRSVIILEGGTLARRNHIVYWLRDWERGGCQTMVFAVMTKPDLQLYRLYASLRAMEEELVDMNFSECRVQIRTLRGG